MRRKNTFSDNQALDLRNHDIQLTVKYIRHLMRELGLELDPLLSILNIPGAERSTYRKIFAKQQPKQSKQPELPPID